MKEFKSQKQLSFPLKIEDRKHKCVLEYFWTEKEECLSILCFSSSLKLSLSAWL
jgi:hypothetical protein